MSVIAPSTGRLVAPKLEYIVPVFGWGEEVSPVGATENWEEFKRVRKGGGLRVYLGRPWFSSDAGE